MGVTIIPFTQPTWAAIIFGVYSIFLFIFLGLVGILIFLAIKSFALGITKKELIQQVALAMCIAGIVASLLVPSFFEFTKLQVSDEGSWTFTNAWGVTLVKLTKNSPRRIAYDSKVVTWYGGVQESKKIGRLYIVTDKKIYPSWVNMDQEKTKQMFGKLDEMTQIQQIPISQNTTTPFSIYKPLQYVRHTLWGLLVCTVLVIWALLRKNKSKLM